MQPATDSWRELVENLELIAAQAGDEAAAAYVQALKRKLIIPTPRLAVVGSEGAGKSTLVNTLLGGPYAPTHASRPATAAPIVFRRSSSGAPGWLLHTADGVQHAMTAQEALPHVVQFDVPPPPPASAPVEPARVQPVQRPRRGFWSLVASPFVLLFKIIFFPFFLFRPKSRPPSRAAPSPSPPPAPTEPSPPKIRREDVVIAYADIDSPTLPPEFWLLDLPGVEGAHNAFSGRPPPEGLLEGARIVVVSRGRNHGPAVRLIGNLDREHIRPAAVIINVTRDDIDEDSSPEDCSGYRKAFLGACAEAKLSCAPEQVFVANLRHFKKPHGEAISALSADHEKLSDFLDREIGGAKENHARDISEASMSAFERLSAALVARKRILDGFLGDPNRAICDIIPKLSAAMAAVPFDAVAAAQSSLVVSRMISAGTSAVQDIAAYAREVRGEISRQEFVFGNHIDGVRSRIYLRESEQLKGVTAQFKTQATMSYSELATRFGSAICADASAVWPINSEAANVLLRSVSQSYSTDFVAPVLPSISVNWDVGKAFAARQPILSAIDRYLDATDVNAYRLSLQKKLEVPVNDLMKAIHRDFIAALKSWRASDPHIRTLVSSELKRVGTMEATLKEKWKNARSNGLII